jgi:hypothetical protein
VADATPKGLEMKTVKSNLSEYTEALESFPRADRAAFEQYFLGYISSSVPSKDWAAAIKAAVKYAASR